MSGRTRWWFCVGEGEGLIALEALRISPGDLRARHDG
jgi:hypothetical protein